MPVLRFVTKVELDSGPRAAVSVEFDAVLDDGRAVTIFDDRGLWWSVPSAAAQEPRSWVWTSVPDLRAEALVAVGPDEAPVDAARDMTTDHWLTVAERLRTAGVTTTGTKLETLPNDVILSPELLRLLPES